MKRVRRNSSYWEKESRKGWKRQLCPEANCQRQIYQQILISSKVWLPVHGIQNFQNLILLKDVIVMKVNLQRANLKSEKQRKC